MYLLVESTEMGHAAPELDVQDKENVMASPSGSVAVIVLIGVGIAFVSTDEMVSEINQSINELKD